LHTIAKLLEKSGVPCVVGGGVAAVYYGAPRVTLDVDFLIPPLTAPEREKLYAALKEEGYKLARTTYVGGARASRFVDPRGNPCDLIEALSEEVRQCAVTDGNSGLRVISLEHLVLSKLASWRSRDKEDLAALLVVRASELDWDFLFSRAEGAGVRNRLEILLHALRVKPNRLAKGPRRPG
jgi:hypothetical protein